jgi:MFS transporter, DHA1 family, multidrug resistance protein
MISWKKNLYIIWFAQLIAMIGMSMVIPFLPLFVKELGVTEPDSLKRWSGLVMSGVFMTAVFATPVWGWLGDRFGKKSMVLRAILGLAISQFLIGLSQDVVQLFIFRMVQGALSGFIAASLALVSSNTPKEKSGYAIGLLASSTAAGNFLGPIVGGVLADAFGFRYVFFITSGLCLISGILIFFLVKEIDKSTSKKNNVWDNYRYVFRNDEVKYSMIILILSAAAISMVQPMFALFIESKVGTVTYLATISGTIFSVLGIFQVIASPWWGKRNDKGKHYKNLSFALLGAGVGYALHVVITIVWFLIPIRALLGFSLGGVLPSLYTFINKNTPVERKGGVMGIASSFTLFGNLLGPLSSGYIASYTSIDFIFILSGIILAIGSLFVYLKFRKKPQEISQPIDDADKVEVKKAETIDESF